MSQMNTTPHWKPLMEVTQADPSKPLDISMLHKRVHVANMLLNDPKASDGHFALAGQQVKRVDEMLQVVFADESLRAFSAVWAADGVPVNNGPRKRTSGIGNQEGASPE